MRLTPSEVALITSGMTTVVAVVSIIATRLNTKDSFRQQRELAQDDRLWQERSDLYVDLIDWVRKDQLFAMRYIEDLSKPHSLPTREELDEGRRRQARIATFASEDVRDLLRLKQDASVRVTSWNVAHAGQGPETQLEDEYRKLADDLSVAIEALVFQIRTELSTARPEPHMQQARIRRSWGGQSSQHERR
jgi:hypothetical protein